MPYGAEFGDHSRDGVGHHARIAHVTRDRHSSLDDATADAIRAEIPAYGSASNPVDVTGGAITDPAVFERCLRAVADDSAVGAILLQFGNSGDETIEVCKDALFRVRDGGVPVAAVFTGSAPEDGTVRELDDRGLLRFEDPVRAVRALGGVFAWGRHRAAVPGRHGESLADDGREAAPRDDWAAMTAALSAHGVEFAPSEPVSDADAAVAAADRLGYPVAVKLDPLAVAHKVDVDGVRTGLADADAVRGAVDAVTRGPDADVLVQRMVDGVELVASVIDDPDFGPILAFGPGGVFVELFDDAFAYRALPIDDEAARAVIAESRADRLLDGVRGRKPADRDAVVDALVGLADAYLALDVETIELNPVIATSAGASAVDLLVE